MWSAWNEREARICLLGLWYLRGLMAAVALVLLPRLLDGGDFFRQSVSRVAWAAGGMALGSLLAGLQKHPRRVLGLAPWGWLGLTLGVGWAACGDVPSNALCAFLGIMAGLVNIPLATTCQIALPLNQRSTGMAARIVSECLVTMVVAGVLFVGAGHDSLAPDAHLWTLAAITGVVTIANWWIFRREITEHLIEFPFYAMYRFRFAGPGLDKFPLRGPVVVVANHSAWMDPMWLAKVLPRSVIPMMTSVFFDNWLLRWPMIYIVDAIRVEASGFRREVPELQTAVAALDAGKCLVIFPEGRLRRSDEQPLKLFGQGVWRILSARPDTPVVVCWIEGGWGSFFSYWHGLPTKNKRFDCCRPLAIAVDAPHVLDKDVLADQLKTRQYLMEHCLEARKYLGLEPFALQPAELEQAKEED